VKAQCKVEARTTCVVTLHCTTPTRIDLLFTMSDNTQSSVVPVRTRRCEVLSRGRIVSLLWRRPAYALSGFGAAAFAALLACRAEAGVACEGWWSLSGSNRRPHACKARALPAELRPHDRKDECKARDRRDDWQTEVHVDQSAFALAGYGATASAHLLACRAEAPLGAKAGGPGKT
jgi:hypothetical protein